MQAAIFDHFQLLIRRIPQLAEDRIVQTFVVIVLLLGFYDPPQLSTSLNFTLISLWDMLPFFALVIGFAAYAKSTNADALIAKVFHGNPMRTVALAAVIGAISPFCSCGVIPLIAAMLGAGVPLAPVMAFWIASPIMDPEMFILTAAGISLNFALAKTLAAISMGLFSGFSVLFLQCLGYLNAPLKLQTNPSCTLGCSNTNASEVEWKFWENPNRITLFVSEAISISAYLGKWLSLAFFLESLMMAYVPTDWIIDYVGESNTFAIPVAAIIGAPSYLNGYAAIPLVSGLISLGMTPGAAMAFITAGAVSSIPAAIAVWALVKKSVFLLYLILGLFGAMFYAWLYELSATVMNF